MSRKGWTTLVIPTQLYEQIATQLPRHGKSVQAFVIFWARAGWTINAMVEALGSQPPEGPD